MLPILVSEAALGPLAYADCVSTAHAAIAIRNWPLRMELQIEKISTIATLMKHKMAKDSSIRSHFYLLLPKS
jgi:hypothetical protein